MAELCPVSTPLLLLLCEAAKAPLGIRDIYNDGCITADFPAGVMWRAGTVTILSTSTTSTMSHCFGR
jgi:hypothetical protein